MFSIKNKIIIITGGGGNGMAHELALGMAERSAVVYCIDINFPIEIPKNLKGNLFYRKCNVTHQYAFQKICEKIFAKHKSIDVLVNGAGVTYPENNKEEYPTKKWNITFDVNLSAAFHCSQSVLKFMKRKKSGSIINFTSINAEMAFPNNPAYVASKGGLKMLGKALAKDWGKYSIRVNSIGPGYMKTDMTKASYNNLKKRKARTSRTLLGRWGEKQDIIGPCIFLASDASRYVTGQDIYVDGGWLSNGLSE